MGSSVREKAGKSTSNSRSTGQVMVMMTTTRTLRALTSLILTLSLHQAQETHHYIQPFYTHRCEMTARIKSVTYVNSHTAQIT